MDEKYHSYAESRLDGNFGEMSSFKFVKIYLTGKKVLDVGCSDGLYLRHFSEESIGIEQIAELAEVCKKQGLNVLNGDVVKVLSELPDSSFEGVFFSNVMEHLDCPVVALRQIHRVMKPGATLVLGLPIERNIFRDVLQMDYFDGTHLYAFSVRNSMKLLADAGFKYNKIYYHLPKCRGFFGGLIENLWNSVSWPFRGYFSMAYWIVAEKI